ncbi:MAG: ABC transporter ATP-binding protein [Turicibacter sp.]
MENAIEVKGISKKYSNFQLNELNLVVPKGYIVGLIGANGAGKSTTIKSILNLVRPDQGSVSIFGLDMTQHELTIKQEIGIVMDESHFPEQLKPKDISLMMKHIYTQWDMPLFDSYLERFNIPRNQIIKEFSKGMKMKLSLATALSHHPRLLILDEPTSGLDPIVRNEILDLFLEFIADEDHSILLSSHITSDLEKVADYITFIHKGNLIFSESKDSLLNDYTIIKCGESDFNQMDKNIMISHRCLSHSYEVLVKKAPVILNKYNHLVMDAPTLEDFMLFHIKGDLKC